MSYTDNLSGIDKGSPRPGSGLYESATGGGSSDDDGVSKADWNKFLTGISKYMKNERIDRIFLLQRDRELTARVDSLERTIKLIKNEANSKSMHFGGLCFANIQDAEAWINLNPEGLKFGYFVDVYSLCLLVANEVHGETGDYLKKLNTAQKSILKSPRETSALAAFNAAVPSLFTNSGKMFSSTHKSAFSRFPKSKTWTTDGCDRISLAITTVGSSLQDQIDMNVSTSDSVKILMKLSVSLSCAFLLRYITWITKSFEDALFSGLRDEVAWRLATTLGESVFRTLSKVRSGVSNSFDMKNPKRLAATVWLMVGRTHDAMQDFMVKDFKYHSAISGEYIKFMVENNNSDEISSYKESLNVLEQKFKELKTKTEKASKTAISALYKAKSAERESKKFARNNPDGSAFISADDDNSESNAVADGDNYDCNDVASFSISADDDDYDSNVVDADSDSNSIASYSIPADDDNDSISVVSYSIQANDGNYDDSNSVASYSIQADDDNYDINAVANLSIPADDSDDYLRASSSVSTSSVSSIHQDVDAGDDPSDSTGVVESEDEAFWS